MNPVMPDLAVRVPKGESADTFFSRFGTSQLQRRWELKACSTCSERGIEHAARRGSTFFTTKTDGSFLDEISPVPNTMLDRQTCSPAHISNGSKTGQK